MRKNSIDKYSFLKAEIKEKKKMISLEYIDEDEAREIEERIEKSDLELSKNTFEELNPYRFAGYNPNVYDFIRRCDTVEQALEIIDFLEKKGDIESTYAIQLKAQLERNGLRSFGPRKEQGFYFHQED